MRTSTLLWLTAVVSTCGTSARPAAGDTDRTFTFTYAASVVGLKPGSRTRVWLPVPPTDATQRVERLAADLPSATTEAVEPRYGNRVLSFCLPANHGSSATFSVTYEVTRHEVAGPIATGPVPDGAAMHSLAALLTAESKVPVGGRPATLLQHAAPPSDGATRARVAFDTVYDHMAYRKDRPGWGTGDADWACDSGFGNCADFHSLYVSLARTERLPSAHQFGFAIGHEAAGSTAGYHCWAWSHVDGGWLPVDVSDAKRHPDRRAYLFGHLDADRVAFSVGRDLDLVPKQAGPPVSFLVDPYAEADGLPIPTAQVVTAYRYGRRDAGRR